jgi:hypothetical protein
MKLESGIIILHGWYSTSLRMLKIYPGKTHHPFTDEYQTSSNAL